jgi:hypothetical protein
LAKWGERDHWISAHNGSRAIRDLSIEELNEIEVAVRDAAEKESERLAEE